MDCAIIGLQWTVKGSQGVWGFLDELQEFNEGEKMGMRLTEVIKEKNENLARI